MWWANTAQSGGEKNLYFTFKEAIEHLMPSRGGGGGLLKQFFMINSKVNKLIGSQTVVVVAGMYNEDRATEWERRNDFECALLHLILVEIKIEWN